MMSKVLQLLVIAVARDRVSDSEDCYVLVVLFLRRPIFRRPWADFRKTATRRGMS